MRAVRAVTVALGAVALWGAYRAGVATSELGRWRANGRVAVAEVPAAAPAPARAERRTRTRRADYAEGARRGWAEGYAAASAGWGYAPPRAYGRAYGYPPPYVVQAPPVLVRERAAPAQVAAADGSNVPWYGRSAARFDDDAGGFERAESEEETGFLAAGRRRGGGLFGGDDEPVGGGGRAVDLSPAPADPKAAADAFAAAERGYARLREGDRRGAAGAFRLAVSLDPDHPNAVAWRRERRRLERQFFAEYYSIIREGGSGAGVGRPVLGGGATGAMAGWSPDPLAKRPLSVFARIYAPHTFRAGEPDGESATAAAGVSWRPLAGVPLTLTAERLFALGEFGRDAWSVRAGGGAEAALPWWGLTWTGYGEGGVVGGRPDLFAGAQTGVERRFGLPGGFSVAPGVGAWGAVEAGRDTVWRADLGPMLRVGNTRARASVSVDYRWRVGGDARPANGPAVTVYGRF